VRLLFWRKRPPERFIFRFMDGRGKELAADPLEAWRAIEEAAGPGWPELLRLLTAPPPPGVVGDVAERRRESQEKAAAALGAAACVAFGVGPLSADGKAGMTRSERVGVVASFLNWMGGVAESARPLASSRPSTEPHPA
jgi:hypothetical protein